MKPDADSPEPRFSLRSSASLVVAVAVVAILLIWLPAYRLFFLISLAIGAVVAGILHLWSKYRPIKEEDVERKRPLGLD
jgi:peptidoglycan biosynthesis protein MviN/MurJ (putative lipid II flippase)